MEKLADFYTLMASTATIRRDLVNYYLIDVAKPSRLEALRKARSQLDEAPSDKQGRLLLTDDNGRSVPVNADYELLELDKDLTFFGEGEAAFASYLGSIHPRFGEETKELVDFLRSRTSAPQPHSFKTFITDRDGTVNNYCARYRSSVQSGYNAVFLSRFASSLQERPIILTSAPLQEIGIVDLSVMPDNTYVLAGSKGREYRDISGERRAYELAEGEQRLIEELNRRLEDLLERSENRVFGFIGSSLQKKHGETTIARQDMNGSIPEEESERFRQEVEEIVADLNESGRSESDGATFQIDDTGKDIEIILGAPSDESESRSEDSGGQAGTSTAQARHFDKGDGIAFLTERLGRRLSGTELLVCGDTASDLPMVQRAIASGAQVSTVFVTTDSDLQKAVRETGADAHFVSTPDVLVAGLDLVTQGDEA